MFTQEQKERWRSQVNRVIEQVSLGEVQVGDSELVMYTREVMEMHKIGPIGRMTLEEGEYTFHAAPAKVKNPSVTEHNYTYTDNGRIFAQTGSIHFSVSLPDYKNKGDGKWNDFQDEQILFKDVFKSKVVLHEPRTMSVVASLQRWEEAAIQTADDQTADYYKRSYRGAYRVKDPKGLVYLGSSLPKQDHKEWVAKIPSPYFVQEGEIKQSYTETPSQFKVSVKRKGKEHEWSFKEGGLENFGGVYIYPPSSLRMLGMSGNSFLVSNVDLGIYVKGTDFLYSSPRYLPALPVKKEIRGGRKYYAYEDGTIMDFREWKENKWIKEGTYYSRRARNPEENWSSYVSSGRPVSFFSTHVPWKTIQLEGNFIYCGSLAIKHSTTYIHNNVSRAYSEATGGTWLSVPTHVTPDGSLLVNYDMIPSGFVLFTDVKEAQMSRWAFFKQPAEVFGAQRVDLSAFHSLSVPKLVDSFSRTDLEVEKGITYSDINSRGLSIQHMQISGYVVYRDQWYHPSSVQGTVRAGPSPLASFSSYDGRLYSTLFDDIRMKRIRKIFLGIQATKVKSVLYAMGIASVVEAPG